LTCFLAPGFPPTNRHYGSHIMTFVGEYGWQGHLFNRTAHVACSARVCPDCSNWFQAVWHVSLGCLRYVRRSWGAARLGERQILSTLLTSRLAVKEATSLLKADCCCVVHCCAVCVTLLFFPVCCVCCCCLPYCCALLRPRLPLQAPTSAALWVKFSFSAKYPLITKLSTFPHQVTVVWFYAASFSHCSVSVVWPMSVLLGQFSINLHKFSLKS